MFNRKKRQKAEEASAWQAERDRVQSYLDRVDSYKGFSNAEDPALPLQLRPGEHALLVVHGASLIAPRHLPGHWVGGNTGVTFRVTRGVNYRVGGTRGQYSEGPEEPQVVDTGVATYTDQRVVFTGSRHAQEWDFVRVLGYHNEDSPTWTAIPVSNRQAVTGIGYDEAHSDEVRFAFALGLARFHGSTESLVADLRSQLAELDAERPAWLEASSPSRSVASTMSEATAASLPVDQTGASLPVDQTGARLPADQTSTTSAHGPATEEPIVQASSTQVPANLTEADRPAPVAPFDFESDKPHTTFVEPQAVGAQETEADLQSSAVDLEQGGAPLQPTAMGVQPTHEDVQQADTSAGQSTAEADTSAGQSSAEADTSAADTSAADTSAGQSTQDQYIGSAPQQQLPPAGWYPDPSGVARLRWWDGSAWSTHTSA
ncbi:MAG TPA: DUF2510 domain-containing protein [Acidimicrobiales bacterium]|nr:DUF2510 domain-containing protein [Acidimicrobiales bacterium]